MSIPNYQRCMLPVLEIIADGADHPLREVKTRVADTLGLTVEERQLRLPSGHTTIIAHRVGWAKTYLKKAGLLSYPSRAMIRITDEGRRVLQQHPLDLNTQFLRQYESFRNFFDGSRSSDDQERQALATEQALETLAPDETIEQAYQTLQNDLADELLERTKACSPQFFEQLVVDLLVRMGYGGSRVEAGRAIGGSGDDGIDGIINEDRLGLDVVCIQAKRWEGTVGRPVVQSFAGSMDGQRARKGVLLTTGSFSKDAREYVTRIERKIVLIDGQQLAQLMIEHDVGVGKDREFVIKKIDQDYFDVEEA